MEINLYSRVNTAYPSPVSKTSRIKPVQNEKANVASVNRDLSKVSDVVSISNAGRQYVDGVRSLDPIQKLSKIETQVNKPKEETSKIEGNISLNDLNNALGVKPKTIASVEEFKLETVQGEQKNQAAIDAYQKVMDMAKPLTLSGQLMANLA